MKEIRLTSGHIAKVDDEDFEFLSQWRWSRRLNSRGRVYVQRTDRSSGRPQTVSLHRAIMERHLGVAALKGRFVDHINHDTLDNQKANLRACDATESAQNKRRYRNNASGYKGVRRHLSCSKWEARIQINKRAVSLGLYETAEQAAEAYNLAAKGSFGPFACLNVIAPLPPA